MAMHSSHCLHCLHNCELPHDDTTLMGVAVGIEASERLRGAVRLPEAGITLGTDEWRPLRCPYCGNEAQTPIEMIAPLSMQDSDGVYLATCVLCLGDMREGRTPGHTRRWLRN